VSRLVTGEESPSRTGLVGRVSLDIGGNNRRAINPLGEWKEGGAGDGVDLPARKKRGPKEQREHRRQPVRARVPSQHPY
jgi:hypothetical protein